MHPGRFFHILTACALIVTFVGGARGQNTAAIDSTIEQVRKAFEVPGISLTVVKDGKVVVAKGYGIKTVGKADNVDPHTLFGIASNTKLFTATALALLVEEGKLEWDAPVVRYLPWFQLSDPYVSRELTIRDLLVHRSGLGLGAGDLLWWPPSNYTRNEIARRLRFIPLSTSFRSAYAYDNVLYLVAGEVIQTVSGLTWEDFVTTRILKALGMTESTVRHGDPGSAKNMATPHARIKGAVQPVKPFDSDNTNPAGGINTNAVDMAKWLITQLDSGRVADGSRLFSPRSTRQLWTIVTPLGFGEPPADLAPLKMNFNGYALGLQVRDFRGIKVLTHTGGLPGYVSRVLMVPQLKLGIAVLTNQESSGAFDAATYGILDMFMKAPAHDWIAGFKHQAARADSMQKAADQRTSVRTDSSMRPPLPLERYAGTYVDPWYGEMEIALRNGALQITMSHTPSLQGTLEYWQYGSFIARWSDPELRADVYVMFTLAPDGKVEHVKMRPVSTETDFSFDFRTWRSHRRRNEGVMNFDQLIRTRQSVRSYTGAPVEPEKLAMLVEAVRLAPSASNAQPWKLILVDDPVLRQGIAAATFSQAISFNRFAPQAPVIAVLTIERTRTITQIGGWLKEREFPLIDIGIAAEHLCLQAADLGLGTCMIGWFNERTIRNLLGIPRGVRIGLLITIGYPSEGYQLRPKTRKEVGEMCANNSY